MKAGGFIAAVGIVALFVGLFADTTEIAANLHTLFGTPGPASPTANVASSPPPPGPAPALQTGTLASSKPPTDENPEKPDEKLKKAEASPRPAFPIKVRLDANQSSTPRGVGAALSISFHVVEGENIATLRIMPDNGTPLTQPFMGAGGFVAFTSGDHRYRASVWDIDWGKQKAEIVIAEID